MRRLQKFLLENGHPCMWPALNKTRTMDFINIPRPKVGNFKVIFCWQLKCPHCRLSIYWYQLVLQIFFSFEDSSVFCYILDRLILLDYYFWEMLFRFVPAFVWVGYTLSPEKILLASHIQCIASNWIFCTGGRVGL